MDKYSFVVASLFSIMLIGISASVDPVGFEEFTGIETSELQQINTGSFSGSQNVVTNSASCNTVTIISSGNVNETAEGFERVPGEEGWVYFDVERISEIFVEVERATFLQRLSGVGWINYRLGAGFVPANTNIIYDNTTLDVSEADSINFSIRNDDAVLKDVISSCKTFDDRSGLSGFVSVLKNGISAILNVVNSFFYVLQAQGNQISMLVLDVYATINIVGWLYIIGEIIKDIIPLT